MALSINEIKYLRSLALKKFRQKYNKFVVEGDKMAREILQSSQFQIDQIYALPDWIGANEDLLRSDFQLVQAVSPKELGRISNLKTPNQVLVIVNKRNPNIDEAILKNHLCLYLDGIQDPGNLGTILRIADWFGIPYVFRSPETVELYNSKVIQASMGAFLRVSSPEIDLATLCQQFPNLPIYGAAMNGESLYKLEPTIFGLIVIGSEGNGINPQNLALIQKAITIPKGKNGGAESLNAAVATGIICSWMVGK